MHLTVELTYPADVGDVADLLSDPSFVRWRTDRPGAGEVSQVDVSGDPQSGFTVSLRRTLTTDVIPAQVRPFVGDRLEVRQTEAWEADDSGRHVGTVVVEITGAPVRLTGTVLLEPAPGGGCRLVYRGELRSSVPLFAGAVEEAAAAAVRRTLEAEEQAVRDWLAGT